MGTVITPNDYVFKDAEILVVKKECSMEDAIKIYWGSDPLRSDMYLIKKMRAKKYHVNTDTTMKTKKFITNNTSHDFFFIENEENNVLFIMYSWGKSYIDLFPDVDYKNHFRNAYDLKDIELPIPNGVAVFGGHMKIENYKKLTYTVRVTIKDSDEYLKTYYENYLNHSFQEDVIINKITISYEKNNSGFHSYARTALYDMTVTITLDESCITTDSIHDDGVIDLIKKDSWKTEELEYFKTIKDKKEILYMFKGEEGYEVFQISLDRSGIIKKADSITSISIFNPERFVGRKYQKKR